MKREITKEQKYDFVNQALAELKPGKKTTVIMEGRVYQVKYKGKERDIYPELLEAK